MIPMWSSRQSEVPPELRQTLLLEGRGTWLLSVAMALEYESICMLADHRLAAGASEEDVRNLLNSIFGIIVPVEVHY